MKLAIPAHLIMIGLLVLVLIYGSGNRLSNVNRWLDLKFFYFQPSEFAKLTLVLFLAGYFRERRKIGSILWYDYIVCLAATGIPFFLIFKQPDFGTAIILPVIFAFVIFVIGIKYKHLMIAGAVSLGAIPIVWSYLKPYQKERILVLFNEESSDPLGNSYQIIQSKIAIGSGNIFGKGFLEGKQGQLNFLPAKHTDFIFALFAEEWGFVGCMVLLCLLIILIYRCLNYVTKSKSRTGAIVAAGVSAIITAHIVINICMVIGLFPIVGMPLSFVSYGGSSIFSMLCGIGLMINARQNSEFSE